MKKKIISFVIILAIFVSLVGITIYVTHNKVNVNQENTVKVLFYYQDKQIEKILSDSESRTVLEILNNKQLYSKEYMGEPSCGFSKNISFQVADEYFELACDGCEYIYCEPTKKFIELDNNEMQLLHSIIENNGGFFPCV